MSTLNAVQPGATYVNLAGRCVGNPIARHMLDPSGACKAWSWNHTVICVYCHRPMVQVDLSGTVISNTNVAVAPASSPAAPPAYTFQQYGIHQAHAQPAHSAHPATFTFAQAQQYAYGQPQPAYQNGSQAPAPSYNDPRYGAHNTGHNTAPTAAAPRWPPVSDSSELSEQSEASELDPYQKQFYQR